ncbi:VOC family protein [Amycolatopsis sp. NPDC051128]|uniref:VOC family protein n=1 Tax=Amycolatopsis sp. NPDC051128 TaxID=3155412 RepID=UPI003425448E
MNRDTGIPTVRNVDHVAYTVPDLDRAITFFADVFDARLLYRQGPVGDPGGDFMRTQLGVHPEASCYVALLRFGAEANVELFEYRAPGQRTVPPANHDVGGHHLAVAVVDLDRAAKWLSGRSDVVLLGEPCEGAPGSGVRRWIYLRTAWGMYLELVEPAPPWDSPAQRFRARPAPSAPGGGLPGFLGLDHVGYTVPDLAQAVGFFTGPLGGTLVHHVELPFDREAGETQWGVPGPGVLHSTTIRLGPVTNVELQFFEVAGRRTVLPENSDVGGHHLAFFVDDVEAAVAALHTVAGVRVLGTPQVVDEGGPIDGDRWTYFRAPWGMQLEVLNLPPGLPYERQTTDRRFGPARSWGTTLAAVVERALAVAAD